MSILVEAEELRSTYGPHIVVLDVSWSLDGAIGLSTFLKGHLPRAKFVDLNKDLAEVPGERGRHPMPEADRLVSVFARLGVSNDMEVVLYDQSEGYGASRAWASLLAVGHERVRVLRGGIRRWKALGYPTEAGVAPESESGQLTLREPQIRIVSKGEMEKLGPGCVVFDARSAERYRGEIEPIDPVGGHIPGARNLPVSKLVDPLGAMLRSSDLQEMFRKSGVDLDSTNEVVTYCGSGVTASHLALGLREAGLSRVAIYMGSWSEWISEPRGAIAVGAESCDSLEG